MEGGWLGVKPASCYRFGQKRLLKCTNVRKTVCFLLFCTHTDCDILTKKGKTIRPVKENWVATQCSHSFLDIISITGHVQCLAGTTDREWVHTPTCSLINQFIMPMPFSLTHYCVFSKGCWKFCCHQEQHEVLKTNCFPFKKNLLFYNTTHSTPLISLCIL